VPANLVRVATGQACRVVLGPGRVKRGARIVRSCCLVRALQLLPVAAWPVGRAAWFAVIRWSVTAARAVIRCLVNCSCCSYLLPGPRCLVAAWWLPADLVAQLLPVAAWSRSCCLVVFVFVFLVGPCL